MYNPFKRGQELIFSANRSYETMSLDFEIYLSELFETQELRVLGECAQFHSSFSIRIIRGNLEKPIVKDQRHFRRYVIRL